MTLPSSPKKRTVNTSSRGMLCGLTLATMTFIVPLVFIACAEDTTNLSPVQFGVGSFYGDGFDGNLTANGETFNRNAMTAAHKHLPFNTMVEVTDLETGETIVVRINDRGPFIPGRIIDLSEGAAKQLGFFNRGVAEVMIVAQ